MTAPTLKIAPKKYSGESTILSMRMAKTMLRDVDAVAEATGRSRNEILTLSIEFALDHMEIIMEEKKDK